MKIVLDTGILVRASHNAQGLARALLLAILDGPHVLVLSAPMLEELDRVLRYPRVVKLTNLEPEGMRLYLDFLAGSSQVVKAEDTVPIPIRDPKDAPVLQTAIAGGVDVVCSLDAHFYKPEMIAFCESRGIRIMKDVDLMRLLRAQKAT